jgi:hydrogenase 3 maturation protease
MHDRQLIMKSIQKNTLFAGMGNRIKSDDGVGIFIAEQLKSMLEADRVIVAENGIENYTGKINRLRPDSVILIDAVDFGEKPGFYKLVPVGEITNTTTNTHNLSLKTLSLFLDVPDIWVLGIQPANVAFGTDLSEEVLNAAQKLIKKIVASPATSNYISV